MATRRVWKTFFLRDGRAYNDLQSAWQSSTSAFGRHKVMHFAGIGLIETNLSMDDLRALGRFAGVRIPWRDMATDTYSVNEEE